MKVSLPRGAAAHARLGLTSALTIALALPALAGSAARSEGGATSARGGNSHVQTLPENYHARFDAELHGAMAKSGDPIARAEPTSAELAAETALSKRIPSLQVSRDDISQFPVMVLSYSPGTFLSTPASKTATSPEAEARAFFRANKALWAMTDNDLSTLRARYVTSPEGGATIVKFDQYINGIQLFDTEIAVALTSEHQVSGVSGRMYGQTDKANLSAASFALPKTDAIAAAIKDLTGRIVSPGDFEKLSDDVGGGYAKFAFTPDRAAGEKPFLTEGVRVKPMLFPLTAGNFVPAYYLEVLTEGVPAGSGPWFAYVIDAESGKLLFRNNLTAHDTYSYRVYAESTGDKRPWDGPTGTVGTPHPVGTPNAYQAPFIAAPLISVESLIGPTDPWLPPGATATTGNNTDAYLDITGANGFSAGDIRGIGVAGVFDAQYDSLQNVNVAVNRQAAVNGMFYQVNWLHDFWYLRGFNELSGNAQTDNYGRGGVAGDSLLAEGQDQSGTDNANMATPADGGKPRMQMYIFSAGGLLNPTREGTFDMLIVGHEMGHYVSNRLIGNASGLTNNQGRSMGEGWGDFNCVLTTTLDTDNVEGTTYAVGGQTDRFLCGASFNDNYYYSIRRYPMSSSKLKNPLTFKDIGSGITTYPGVSGNPCSSLTGSPAAVHNSGEIWAQMLWQCFVGLSRAYGVATARIKITQYMLDGMKMTPSQPTFTQARDGVIAATNAANGNANPKDAQILWQAFAFRGIGTAAVSPLLNSNNHAGVVQDFTAAPGLPDDTIGIYTGGVFFERDVTFPGTADQVFSFGAGGLAPIVGNWDGSTGVGAGSADTPGLYDTATGNFFLKNTNGSGPADLVFGFGPGGVGAVPVVGDWDGNGSTTIGIYVPATGSFFLKNSNAAGGADLVFNFGPGPSTLLPVVGDWDGNGTDTIGLYDPVTGNFFLKNSNAPGGADLTFGFGAGGDFVPLGGDWNSDNTDSIGIYSPSLGLFFLRNSNSPGVADETLSFGPTGAIPVVGNFDGM